MSKYGNAGSAFGKKEEVDLEPVLQAVSEVASATSAMVDGVAEAKAAALDAAAKAELARAVSAQHSANFDEFIDGVLGTDTSST